MSSSTRRAAPWPSSPIKRPGKRWTTDSRTHRRVPRSTAHRLMRRATLRQAAHRGDRERGSATIWAICALTLLSAAVGWVLLWVTAESARHSAEQTADTAALTATHAALRRLATETGPAPCEAAALAVGQTGARLVACACVPLDCLVAVQKSVPLLGSFAEGLPGASRVYSIQARSRAGPVGQSGADVVGTGQDGIGVAEGEMS